jgi:hypothetical protein
MDDDTPSPPPLALINLAGHLIARTARYASDYRLERPIPCCPRVATKPRHHWKCLIYNDYVL